MTRRRELRSDRLALRALDVSDAAFVESLYGDARVTRMLSRIQGPISIEEARAFCRPSGAFGEQRFGAAIQPDGELIAVGTVRMHADAPGVATIGYSLLPAFWGRGFGTELAGLLVEFAFGERVSEVRATTRDDNLASGRVLEKLGFTAVEVGVPEVDSRGDERRVTRWSLHIGSERLDQAERRA